MTNVLIRRLIGCGYSPDVASEICCAYIQNFSLADLDSVITIMEKSDVDKVQSEPYRKKRRRLLSASNC